MHTKGPYKSDILGQHIEFFLYSRHIWDSIEKTLWQLPDGNNSKSAKKKGFFEEKQYPKKQTKSEKKNPCKKEKEQTNIASLNKLS